MKRYSESHEHLTMTVRELIAALQAIAEEHGDAGVMSEGCDCSGSVASIRPYGDGEVLLERYVEPEEDEPTGKP